MQLIVCWSLYNVSVSFVQEKDEIKIYCSIVEKNV